MKAKFTPGPWQYCGQNRDKPEHCQCGQVSDKHGPVATVERGEWGDHWPAIRITDDGKAEIDLDRCIGCGLCVTACPTEAMRLTPKPEEERRTPPATGLEQMKLMAEKRGLSV